MLASIKGVKRWGELNRDRNGSRKKDIIECKDKRGKKMSERE